MASGLNYSKRASSCPGEGLWASDNLGPAGLLLLQEKAGLGVMSLSLWWAVTAVLWLAVLIMLLVCGV